MNLLCGQRCRACMTFFVVRMGMQRNFKSSTASFQNLEINSSIPSGLQGGLIQHGAANPAIQL